MKVMKKEKMYRIIDVRVKDDDSDSDESTSTGGGDDPADAPCKL
jgi:hypothetical protein